MVDDMSRREDLDTVDDDETAEPDANDLAPVHPAMERVAGGRLLGIAAILGAAVAAGFGIYAYVAATEGPHRGLEGVVLLVAGFATVGVLLYLGTLILRALDMGAPGSALGMPEGSIRALIAMSLILIFAIIGIQVFTAGLGGTETTSSGITEAQIQGLRADGAQILSQTLLSPVPASPAPPLYTVTTRSAMTEDAHDFGLQLMTTVSTLVVAVAGFYFGSRAVAEGSVGVDRQLRLARSYSNRRRANVIGPQPDPDAATDGDAADEPLDDEVAAAFEEGTAPVQSEVDAASVTDTESPETEVADLGGAIAEEDTVMPDDTPVPDDERPRRDEEL